MPSQALYVAICHQRRAGDARHWILMLAPENAEQGTWYHVTGGPTTNRAYKLEIQTKRVNSHGVETHHHVANIEQKDVKKVKSSAQKISPKFFQRWAVDVLRDLERKSLVPQGTYDTWFQNMEVDPYSSDGASGNYAGSSSAAGGSSAAPVEQSTTTTAAGQTPTAAYAQENTAKSDWVWDENTHSYRYWDATTQNWIWQQHTGSQ